jgi:hypothetical protein
MKPLSHQERLNRELEELRAIRDDAWDLVIDTKRHSLDHPDWQLPPGLQARFDRLNQALGPAGVPETLCLKLLREFDQRLRFVEALCNLRHVQTPPAAPVLQSSPELDELERQRLSGEESQEPVEELQP